MEPTCVMKADMNWMSNIRFNGWHVLGVSVLSGVLTPVLHGLFKGLGLNENEGLNMERKLTIQELRDLAECERQMDAGEVSFVVWDGGRMMVQPLVMEELGLESGQTVSQAIAGAIMNAHLAACQADVALAKLSN